MHYFLAVLNHKSVKKPGVAMVKRPTATGDINISLFPTYFSAISQTFL